MCRCVLVRWRALAHADIGSAGTEVTLQSVTPCPPMPAGGERYQVNAQFSELPVIIPLGPEGGRWQTRTVIAGVIPGQDIIEFPAACNVIGNDSRLQPTLMFRPVRFTLVAALPPAAPPATPLPAAPRFTG
jgi:hypothetical protein